MRLRYLIYLLLPCMYLSSCSSISPVMRDVYKINGKVQKNVEKLVKQSQAPLPKANASSVKVVHDIYLGANSKIYNKEKRLPNAFNVTDVTIMNAQPLTLLQIASFITQTTNLTVTFAPDIITKKSDKTNNGGENQRLEKPVKMNIDAQHMRVAFAGHLASFLDHVAGYYGLDWRYKDGNIEFFKNVTKIFYLAALPIKSTNSSSMSTGNIGGKTSGGASSSASFSTNIDFWKDLKTSLKNIVGKSGIFSISESSESITVTAPYDIVKNVHEYIQRLNQTLLRELSIQVKIYNVALDAQTILDFNPTVMFSNSKFTAGGAYDNAATLLATGKTGDMLAGSTTGQIKGLNIASGILTGKFAGSNASITANDTDGSTTLVHSINLVTMSGQAVPVQMVDVAGYVKGSKTTVTNGVVTTTITTATITSGLTLEILPRVMDDGRILLQYALNSSELTGTGSDVPGFNEVKTSGTTVELPSVAQRSFIQEALMNNASTIAIASFSKDANSASDKGVGTPSLKLLGGGYNGKKTRVMLVITITPIILNNKVNT